MVVMALIQTPENVGSATTRMGALVDEAGKQSVAIQPLQSISPLQISTRNQRSPYRSRIQPELLLSNRLRGSSLLRPSLLPTSSHLSSQLRLPLARRGIVRMPRMLWYRQRSIRRWRFHLTTKFLTVIMWQRTLARIRIL